MLGLRVREFRCKPRRCMHACSETLHMKAYSPPQVDRKWLWVYYNKIPNYPIFYLLKGDYTCKYIHPGAEKHSSLQLRIECSHVLVRIHAYA